MRILLLVLLFSVSALAQTSSDLRQKYGEPISETFKIRPQVLLTVSYAKTGEVCSMLIEPQDTWVGYTKLNDTEPLKGKVLNEILEELAPKNQRGKFLMGTHRNGLLEYYERIDVQRSGQIDKWNYAVIYWKIKACEN